MYNNVTNAICTAHTRYITIHTVCTRTFASSSTTYCRMERYNEVGCCAGWKGADCDERKDQFIVFDIAVETLSGYIVDTQLIFYVTGL